MSNDMKCQHEWEYFDEHDFPNGYEYEQVNIPHKRCKKCGREYELFDGYGEYAKRWRKVEYWSPELHKLEQELIRTRKELEQSETCCTEWEKQALDYKAENIALSGELERTRKTLEIAVDALKSAKKRLELINNSKFANLNNVLQIQSQCEILKMEESLEQITALEQKDVK